MEALLVCLAVFSTLSWVGFALSPWGLWRNREVLEVTDATEGDDPLAEITAVIPARNEAGIIQRTVLSVAAQGAELKIILIDDGSEDGTAATTRASRNPIYESCRARRCPTVGAANFGRSNKADGKLILDIRCFWTQT